MLWGSLFTSKHSKIIYYPEPCSNHYGHYVILWTCVWTWHIHTHFGGFKPDTREKVVIVVAKPRCQENDRLRVFPNP